MNRQAGVGILFIQEDGPSVVVRSVVKNGPAANSARPPVPGDTLLKVDGYDVRGIGLTELRPWIVGDEGSVVTLSFASANTRYDTSIVRVVSGSVASLDHMSSKLTNPYAKYADSVPEYERWRQDPLYNPAADGGRENNSYGEDNSYEYDAGPGFRVADHKTYTSSPLQYPKRASRSPDMSFLQHTPTTSWAMEADKILAEAQAKIEDALHRERLLQETLDMLREKNAAKMQMHRDTRQGLEMQRDRLKEEVEEERNRLRFETMGKDAVEMELRKSEERLFALTSHHDRSNTDRALF